MHRAPGGIDDVLNTFHKIPILNVDNPKYRIVLYALSTYCLIDILRDRKQKKMTPKQVAAKVMLRNEQLHVDDLRAKFIAQICDQYRDGEAELKLLRPHGGGNLHLFVNGKCAGFFDDAKRGLVFRAVGGGVL